MAPLPSLVLRCIAFSLLFSCAVSVESVDETQPPFSFSFERFEKDGRFDSEIALYGDAEVSSSMVRMFGKGRMMCKRPIRFFGRSPGLSTNFSFSISAGYGESLAFLLVPNNLSLISTDRGKSGVSPRFVAVKFDAGASGIQVAIDVGGEITAKRSNLSDANLALNSEQKLHSWIDYDGDSKMIEARLGKSRDLRPGKALISCPIDLSNALWREAMYVGISSSSGNSNQISSIYSWSFGVKHGAAYLMHSEPLDPKSVSVHSHEDSPIHLRRKSSPWKILVALLVGAVCGAVVASAVFLLRARVAKRHPVTPVEYPVLVVETGHEKIAPDGIKVVGNTAK